MITIKEVGGKHTILITKTEVMGKLLSVQRDIRDIQSGIVQQWNSGTLDGVSRYGVGVVLRDLDSSASSIAAALEALRSSGYDKE